MWQLFVNPRPSHKDPDNPIDNTTNHWSCTDQGTPTEGAIPLLVRRGHAAPQIPAHNALNPAILKLLLHHNIWICVDIWQKLLQGGRDAIKFLAFIFCLQFEFFNLLKCSFLEVT